jgi:hypothetical protein
MATPSGLGVSTGIGKGEAQVFAPVKSEYFKNKANLFNPDTEEYKQELAKVRQFYRDNQRSILEGDFDTKLKLNQLTSGLTQWAANSNAEGKVWEALKKKAAAGETKFYQKDLDNLTKYYSTPYSKRRGMQIGLRDAFDTDAFLEEGRDIVKDLPFKDGGYKLQSIVNSDGKLTDMIVNTQTQESYSLDDIVDKMFLGSNAKFSEEQVNSKITRDQTKDYLKKFLDKKITNKLVGGININNQVSTGDEVSAFNLTPTDIKTKLTIPFGQGSEAGKIGMNDGTVTIKRQVSHNSPIKYRGAIPTNAIFASGSYAYQKDGKGDIIKGEVTPGENNFNLQEAKGGIAKNVDWNIGVSGVYPTFKNYTFSDEKGGGVDVSGYPIGEESINSPAFKDKKGEVEMRFYATLEYDDDQVLYVPYHKVAATINRAYKTKDDKKNRLKWYNETKQYLIDNNYKQAYFDFTGKEMPTSSNKSNPNSQPKGKTVTFQGKEYKLQAGEEIRKKDGKFYIINTKNNTARPI